MNSTAVGAHDHQLASTQSLKQSLHVEIHCDSSNSKQKNINITKTSSRAFSR